MHLTYDTILQEKKQQLALVWNFEQYARNSIDMLQQRLTAPHGHDYIQYYLQKFSTDLLKYVILAYIYIYIYLKQ